MVRESLIKGLYLNRVLGRRDDQSGRLHWFIFLPALCAAFAQVGAVAEEVVETEHALPIERLQFDDGKLCTASDVLFHNARVYTPIDSGVTPIKEALTTSKSKTFKSPISERN